VKIKSTEALTAILLGGAIAGAVDIVAASLIYLQNPARVLQTIAGGLLAKATYGGGVATVFLGVLLQESMGILIAAIYLLISALLPSWRRHWIASGAAAGIVIFYVMNYVVVPLSAWKSKPHFSLERFVENLAAMLLFGLIVAFFCRRLAESIDPQMKVAKTPT
jgi:uncharacterized membrane protein YagU involved in acid resistance